MDMNVALRNFVSVLARAYGAETGLDLGGLAEAAERYVADGTLRQPDPFTYAECAGEHVACSLDLESLTDRPEVVAYLRANGMTEVEALSEWAEEIAGCLDDFDYGQALYGALDRMAGSHDAPGPDEWIEANEGRAQEIADTFVPRSVDGCERAWACRVGGLEVLLTLPREGDEPCERGAVPGLPMVSFLDDCGAHFGGADGAQYPGWFRGADDEWALGKAKEWAAWLAIRTDVELREALGTKQERPAPHHARA